MRRDGVTFPQRQDYAKEPQRQLNRKISEPVFQKENPQKFNRLVNANKKDMIENTIAILLEMINSGETNHEILTELVSSLKQYKTDIENEVILASSANDSEYLEELFILNDRIQNVLDTYNESQILDESHDTEEGIQVTVPINHIKKDLKTDSKFNFNFGNNQDEFSAMSYATQVPNKSELFSPEKNKTEINPRLPRLSEEITLVNSRSIAVTQSMKNQVSESTPIFENSDIQNLNGKYEKMKLKNRELKNETQKLKEFIRDLDNSIIAKNKENVEHVEKLQRYKEFERKTALVIKENEKLKARLLSSNDKDKIYNDLVTENDNLKDENQEIKSQLGDLQAEIEKYREVLVELENTLTEKEKEMLKIREKTDKYKEIERKTALVINENEKLKSRLLASGDKDTLYNELVAENNQLKQENQEIRKQLSYLNEDNNSLKLAVKDYRDNEQLLEKSLEENSKLNEIIHSIKDKDTELEKSRLEIQDLKDKLKASHIKEKELANAAIEIDKLRGLVQISEGKLNELVLIKGENEKLKITVKKNEDKMNRLSNRIDELKANSSSIAEIYIQINELQTKITNLKQKNSDLKQKLVSSKMKIEELEKDQEKLTFLDAMTIENDNLKLQLKSKDEQNKKISQLEQKIKKLVNEIEENSRN